MRYTYTFARLGIVAAGASVGLVTAAAVGTASADSSIHWASVIDDVGGLAAAGTPTDMDLQISTDGTNLFSTVGNEATATSGMGGIAIAWGDGATASATGGTGNFAFALGSSATALAGGLSSDSGADHNIAVDIGNNSRDPNVVGNLNGAVAGSGHLLGNDLGVGSNNSAINIGDNVNAAGAGAYAFGGNHNFALGIGEHVSGGSAAAFEGDGNSAIDIGNTSALGTGAAAFDGNGNVATFIGNDSSAGAGAAAFDGNGNVAAYIANNSADLAKAVAFNGDNNIAYVGSSNGVANAFGGNDNIAGVIGPANSTVTAAGGDSNIAYILDPFGSTTSSANAFGHDFDLAAVFFADGDASANTDDYLYDIVSFLGHAYGSFVAAGSDLLNQINALFAL